MIKKCISLILTATILMGVIPVYAAKSSTPLISEGFTSYAENETSVKTVAAAAGTDTRVISDGGNKALYSRAYGDSVLLKTNLPHSDSTKTVMSADFKITGAKTGGKLFNADFSGVKLSFVTIYEDGSLRLSNGKIIGGTANGRWQNITIAADWSKKIYDVYVAQKKIVSKWPLPNGSYVSAPQSLEWQLDWNEREESGFYIDNIRVYDGSVLPWERSFPAEKPTDEVLEFSPATELDTSVDIYTDIDFGDKSNGISVVEKNGGGNITSEKDDDGLDVMHFLADAKAAGGSYMDITNKGLKTVSRYVVEIRMKINNLSGKGSIGLFDTKDSDGVWKLGYDIGAKGSIISHANGSTVGKIPPGEWTTVSFARNILSGKTDVYVNGTLTGSHAVTDNYYPVIFRIDLINAVGSIHDVVYDYIKIYSGTKPYSEETADKDKTPSQSMDYTTLPGGGSASGSGSENSQLQKVTRGSIMDPPVKLKAALDGKTVFMTVNETMYIDGKKSSYSDLPAKPYDDNGTLMLPAEMFSLFSGHSVDHNAATGEITIGKRATMTVNQKECTIGGTVTLFGHAPVIKDGAVYLPMREACEKILGKAVTWDNRGFAVIADEAVELTGEFHYKDRYIQWHPIDLIYRYMCFDNPDGYEMIEALEANFPDKSHPRIIYTYDDVDYILDRADENSEWKKAVDYEMKMAESYLTKDYSAYYVVGDSGKQSAAGVMQKAIDALSTAFLLTGDTKYAAKGVEIMKGFCSWKTMGISTSNLTTGPWAAGIGVGFDIFYNYMLSSEQGREDMKYIKDSVSRLVYNDHILAYEKGIGHGWIVLQDNFVGVCSGGMMLLCLAMADEEDMRDDSAYIMQNIYKSMQTAVSLYYPNGGYYESVNYSNYLLDNFLTGINAMFTCLGTDYGLGNAKGFTDAGDFFTYIQSAYSCMGFHDGGPSYSSNPVREFFGYRYGDMYGAQLGRQQKLLGNQNFTLEALYYYEKAIEANGGTIPNVSDAPLDYYFYGAETGAFRNTHAVSNQVFVGFHGGWTNIVHDMLDLGSFMFESDNVRWATDLGSDSYNLPSYFAKDGYKIYRKRPEGENCIVLNPQSEPDTYYGQELGVFAEIIDLDMNKPKGAKMAYDLTSAYQRDAEKYIRGFYFGDDRNTLIVQDELKLKGETELYWFMHTATDIEIISNTKARLTGSNGKTLTVDVYCDASGYELKSMAAEPLPSSPVVEGQNPNTGYRKLAIYIPSCSGSVNISVKLSPDSGDYVHTPLSFIPISRWTIPDGELVQKPLLTGVYVDGKMLTTFLPGATLYEVELPYGHTEVPYITATSDHGSVEVVQADDLYDTAVITLKADGFSDSVCQVRFNVSDMRDIYVTDALTDVTPEVGKKGEEIMPLRASAFTTPEPMNSADKMLDGDLSTRATQEGTEMWYEFDFGEVTDIEGVSMAFYDGDIRSFIYELWYSEDGINFKKVFKGQSTGTTSDWESLAIAGRVRYIRFVGNGNTSSKWNSITEFRAYR